MALAYDPVAQFGPGATLSPPCAPLFGPTINTDAMVPANTIAPTHRYHMVSGTGLVKTITLPDPSFQGSITFIATGIWTWDATGNIAIAGTTTAAQKTHTFTYSPIDKKWHPDKIA